MPCYIIRILAAGAVFSAVAGCGTLHHLNEPSRSHQGPDVANLSSLRDFPYETAEKNGLTVSYNLFFAKSSNLSGYRLTLIFRNTGTTSRLIRPKISLQDSSGLIIPPYAYQAFVAEAALLAGTEVPRVPMELGRTSYRHEGTITSPTGGTYYYSGTTTPSLGSSFSRGFAQGEAMRAASDRKEGQQMLQWASSFWLRDVYELPAGAATSGALFFPVPQVGQLPLRLIVETSEDRFEFTTVGRQ